MQRRIREQAINIANSNLIVPSKKRIQSGKTQSTLGSSFKFLMTSFSSGAKIAATTEEDCDTKSNEIVQVTESAGTGISKKSQSPDLLVASELPERDLYDAKEFDEDSKPLSKSGQTAKVGIITPSSFKLTDEQAKVLSAAAMATAKLTSPAVGSHKSFASTTGAIKSSKAGTPPSSSPIQGHNIPEMQLRMQNIKSKDSEDEDGHIHRNKHVRGALNNEGSRDSSPLHSARSVQPATHVVARESNIELSQMVASDQTPKQQTQKRVRLSDSSTCNISDTTIPTPMIAIDKTSPAIDQASGALFISSNSRKSGRSRASSDAASTGSDGAGSMNGTTTRVSFSFGASTEVEEEVIELDQPEDVEIFQTVDM